MDIFDFWARIADDATVHPDDKNVFERVNSQFQPDCLPTAYWGPLRTAKVVLLFLSPGYTSFDSKQARLAAGRDLYRRQRSGWASFPSEDEHAPLYSWWCRVTKQFEVSPDFLSDKAAVLNMGAYHSADFDDWHMLTALTSSRVALNYAQHVLFPEAEAGKRVVICLRSPRFWGLAKANAKNGAVYGNGLFAPLTTQGGLMHKGDLRKNIIEVVKRKLA